MKYLYLLLVTVLITGCSGKDYYPTQVSGKITFGKYTVSPPMNYWYYPRIFPSTLKDSDDIFILTFHEHKESLTKTYPDKNGLIFTIAIAKNDYNTAIDYYDVTKKLVKYSELPYEAKEFIIPNNWSCMQVVSGMRGIECISLGEDLITIAEFGYENNKILANFDLLHKMVQSFRENK